MTETFRIPYPPTDAGRKAWNKLYGLNAIYSGKHWSKRREDAEYWHMITGAALNRSKCRRKPFLKPVSISYGFNDRLDLSNHAYIAKMIEDAIKGRIITDDSRRYVREIRYYWHNEPYIIVTVKEVDQ